MSVFSSGTCRSQLGESKVREPRRVTSPHWGPWKPHLKHFLELGCSVFPGALSVPQASQWQAVALRVLAATTALWLKRVGVFRISQKHSIKPSASFTLPKPPGLGLDACPLRPAHLSSHITWSRGLTSSFPVLAVHTPHIFV